MMYGFSFGAGRASKKAGGAFDPASLPLTGWWRDFTGDPWVSEASAGPSAGRELTGTASVGATLNGHASAFYDGADEMVSDGGLVLSDFIDADEWFSWTLLEMDSLASDPGAGSRWNTTAVWGDNQATDVQVTIHAGGASTFVASSSSEVTGSGAATSTPLIVFAKQVGGNIYVAINNGSWVSDTSSNVAALTEVLALGRGAGGTIDGGMWDFGISKTAFDDTTRDNIRNYINARYGLAIA